jgi:hypothetical protein
VEIATDEDKKGTTAMRPTTTRWPVAWHRTEMGKGRKVITLATYISPISFNTDYRG